MERGVTLHRAIEFLPDWPLVATDPMRDPLIMESGWVLLTNPSVIIFGYLISSLSDDWTDIDKAGPAVSVIEWPFNKVCVPLPNVPGLVTCIGESLRVSNRSVAHSPLHALRNMDLIENSIVPTVRSAQEHGPGGTAQTYGRVGSLKCQSFCGQSIDIRSSASGAPADGVPALLVSEDEEDVR